MKRIFVCFLILVLLAVPVCASRTLIHDDAGYLTDYDAENLEETYAGYVTEYGFTPVVVTTDSFGGLDAEEFANEYYDIIGAPRDGILLLVSLKEKQWYVLTSGACHDRISDREAEAIGEELVPMIKSGTYYAAFLKFPELAAEIYEENAPLYYEEPTHGDEMPVSRKNYGKTVAISMAVGMCIGLIAAGVMAMQMKSVKHQDSASDYVRAGSMQLTQSRDIFLYSHVSRTPKPKNNSSGGGSSGGSRGGAGGRL